MQRRVLEKKVLDQRRGDDGIHTDPRIDYLLQVTLRLYHYQSSRFRRRHIAACTDYRVDVFEVRHFAAPLKIEYASEKRALPVTELIAPHLQETPYLRLENDDQSDNRHWSDCR